MVAPSPIVCPTSLPEPLTPFVGRAQEVESALKVVRLLVAGLTARQDVEALFLSPKTAQGHVARNFTKLNVNTRTAAAAAALQAGLVADQDIPR
jgi:DNA-binding CsgD family transcriptional regulator